MVESGSMSGGWMQESSGGSKPKLAEGDLKGLSKEEDPWVSWISAKPLVEVMGFLFGVLLCSKHLPVSAGLDSAPPGPGSCAPPLARGGPRLPGSGCQSRALALEELGARLGPTSRAVRAAQRAGSQSRSRSRAAGWDPEPESEPEPRAGAASWKPRAGAASWKPRAGSPSRARAEHARYGDGGLLLHILMGLSGADRTLYCLQLGPGASFKFMATLLLADCNYFCQPVDYNRASSGPAASASLGACSTSKICAPPHAASTWIKNLLFNKQDLHVLRIELSIFGKSSFDHSKAVPPYSWANKQTADGERVLVVLLKGC
ncbi:uncharacterized protein LOC144374824 [Ictidomys tridecemlineatus]